MTLYEDTGKTQLCTGVMGECETMAADLEAFKYSDERYRIAAENSSEFILDYNILDQSILYVTKSVEQIYGISQMVEYAVEHLIEKGIIMPEFSDIFRDVFQKCREGEPEARCEIQSRTAAGEIRRVELILTTIFDQDKRPVRAVGVWKDITPQAVAESMDTCTYIVDPYTHVLQFVNQNMRIAIPKAQCGTICYQTLRGRSEPCEDCPIARMLAEGSKQYHTQFYLEPYRTWCEVTASMIRLDEGRELALFSGYGFKEYRDEAGKYWVGAEAFTQDTVLYRALCSTTDDYIYICDVPKKLFYFPQSMVEEFGFPGQVVEDAIQMWGHQIHPNERAEFLRSIEELFDGKKDTHCQQYRVRRPDGSWVWLRSRGHMERNSQGEPMLYAGMITHLEKKSDVDCLSGLLNKYAFESYVHVRQAEDPVHFTMLMLGLDNFKSINSLYGWKFGDHVIRDSAQKIQALLPDATPVFRLDGDKFAVILNKNQDVQDLYRMIRSEFEQQQQFEDRRYYCAISGGYTVVEGELTFAALVKQAEYALEYSKAEGKSCLSSFSEELMSSRDRMLTLIEYLRESVDNDFRNFEAFFQPQVDVATREIKSAEALLRWRCEEYGEVTPTEFIPLLEQTGLIHFVGRWILEQAVSVCKEWRSIIPDFTISVNLSSIQLQDPEFLPYLASLIADYGLGTSAIHLELTERSAIKGKKPLSQIFQDLRRIGLGVEMDDFGTGYSSLELLKRAPADVVKIDRAFVMEITENAFDAAFIRVIVALCHSVDIKVCLEGVETWQEFGMVEPMGLDLIQGFLFGKPQNRYDFKKTFLLKD